MTPPLLTIRSVRSDARRCPDGAAARNQRTVNSQRPPALDRSRDGRRRDRAVLSLLLRRDGGGGDRPRAGRRDRGDCGRPIGAAGRRGEARPALQADRCSGHRPDGARGAGRRLMGRAVDRRRLAARQLPRRLAATDSGLQQQWPRPDGARKGRRRGRRIAGAWIPRHKIASRTRRAARRPGGGSCGPRPSSRRSSLDGRLQSGAFRC